MGFLFRLLGSLLALALLLVLVAGGAAYLVAENDLPPGIDRLNEDGTQYGGYFEGFTDPTLDISIKASPVKLRQGRRVGVLDKDYAYIHYDIDAETKEILGQRAVVVSRFFETDFASIPWPANYLINPFGDHAEAAVIHDWLYAVGQKGDGNRRDADLMFYHAMRSSGVPLWRRKVMYGAVRLGGGRGYGTEDEWTDGRFFEPNVSEFIPQECVVPRDLTLFTPEMFVSEATGLLLSQPDGSGSAPLDVYMTARWREAFAPEACQEFLLEAVSTLETFSSVKDVNIVSVDSVQRVETRAMMMEAPPPPPLRLPRNVQAAADRAMRDIFGEQFVLVQARKDDEIRRADQEDEIRAALDPFVRASEIEAVIATYREIEAKGDRVRRQLGPEARRIRNVGSITHTPVERLFEDVYAYTALRFENDALLNTARARYFGDPVTLSVVEGSLGTDAEDLFNRIIDEN